MADGLQYLEVRMRPTCNTPDEQAQSEKVAIE